MVTIDKDKYELSDRDSKDACHKCCFRESTRNTDEVICRMSYHKVIEPALGGCLDRWFIEKPEQELIW